MAKVVILEVLLPILIGLVAVAGHFAGYHYEWLGTARRPLLKAGSLT